MDPIHVHSQFDPEQRAMAIVEEVEREALDEDMVSSTLQRMMQLFASRCQRADEIINTTRVEQVRAARSERLREKQKGVAPQLPKGRVQIVPPGALRAVNGAH